MAAEKFEKLTKVIPASKEKQLGLTIIEKDGKAVVGTVEPNSLAVDLFKSNDVVVSINGETVENKDQCRELLLNAQLDCKGYEIVIEKKVQEKVTKTKSQENVLEKQIQENIEIPELDLQPSPQQESSKNVIQIESPEFDFQSTAPKKSAKKKNFPPTQGFQLGFIEDDEFILGNPLDGLTFPQPLDVRQILKKRIPEIMATYQQQQQRKSEANILQQVKKSIAKQVQFEEQPQHQAIGSDVPESKTLAKVKK